MQWIGKCNQTKSLIHYVAVNGRFDVEIDSREWWKGRQIPQDDHETPLLHGRLEEDKREDGKSGTVWGINCNKNNNSVFQAEMSVYLLEAKF